MLFWDTLLSLCGGFATSLYPELKILAVRIEGEALVIEIDDLWKLAIEGVKGRIIHDPNDT